MQTSVDTSMLNTGLRDGFWMTCWLEGENECSSGNVRKRNKGGLYASSYAAAAAAGADAGVADNKMKHEDSVTG
jgi:hypothetical protein